MSLMCWKKILQGVFVSSIPAMLAIAPADNSQPSKLVLNGCCVGFKGTYRSSVHLELSKKLLKAVSYEECIALCKKAYEEFNRDPSVAFENCVEVKQKKGKNTMLRCDYVETRRCVGGRLPAGIEECGTVEANTELGTYFAKVAYLEEAAVTAFEYLAQELEAYQAPASLSEHAHLAVKEEEEHMHMTRLLAVAYGAKVPSVKVEPFSLRSLSEIAIENAVEGCIRESYAALTAQWQSVTSDSEAVRAVMSRIADDETGHAALSWAIDEWITPLLTVEEQEQKLQAQRDFLEELLHSEQKSPSETMHKTAGFPSQAQAGILLKQFTSRFWS